MIRALLIDPEACTVSECVLDENANRPLFKQMQDAIGCDCMDTVRVDKDHIALVDDNGLIGPKQLKRCITPFYSQPLAGNILITGVDYEGETIDCTLDPFILAKYIRWQLN